MGWKRGHLRLLLAVLGLLAVTPAAADEATAEPIATTELSEEDLEILGALELLLQLEMLESWDPVENLPIPARSDVKGGEAP